MAGPYEMIALDLDSQIQLLSRIQFLTRFSSHFVQITGEKGAGKTWLSERYLESWANDPIQSLLICNSNQQDSQHRAIILRQIVRDGVFNEQNTILQSLDHMLEGQPVHALIVIDDAHRLSANIVAELWALVSEAQRRDGWQINVLLFSLRGKLNKWLHKLSSGQGKKPLELEISPLTDTERDMFIDVLLANKKRDAAASRVLKQKALSLPPLPGLIRELGSQEVTSMDEKKPASRWVMTFLVVALVVVGGALLWLLFMSNTSKTDNTASALTKQEVLAMEEQAMMSETPTLTDIIEQNDDNVMTDTVPLPPQVTIEGMTVGRSDKNRLEVVLTESEVDALAVDALIDENVINDEMLHPPADSLVAVEVAKKAVKPELIVVPITKSEVSAAKITRPITKPTKKSIATPTSNALTFPLANQMLLSIPSTYYALQLAALKSEQAVNEFIQLHNLQNHVFIYETRRSGAPWFMILFDKYPTILDARQAERQLPENLRALAPWPKSFARIHEEIELLN